MADQIQDQHGGERPLAIRDEKGRFVRGAPSPNPRGRPRGTGRPQIPRIARELAASRGQTIDDTIAEVFDATVNAARAGNVLASKLILDTCASTTDEAPDDGWPVRLGEGSRFPMLVGGSMGRGPQLPEDLEQLFAELAKIDEELGGGVERELGIDERIYFAELERHRRQTEIDAILS